MAKIDQSPARAGEQHVLTPLFSALQGVFTKPRKKLPPPVSGSLCRTTAFARKHIHFESIEPRVLLSADVNPTALTVGGSIDVPGEQDSYEFTVEETTRIVFDSQTNNYGLNWRLDGPVGQISNQQFSSTDPAIELVAGKYLLTVDGSGDQTGAYNLRLIDAATAADLTPGEAVSGTLDGGNKTAVYRFSAAAGDKFFYDGISMSGGSAYWRLIDPYGRQEQGSNYLPYDFDTFVVQRTGTYLLLVDGSNSNTAPVNYSFNLSQVQDSTNVLSLDTVATADIDHAGKTTNFTFSLAEATEVLFDDLSNNGQFYWALTGPDGQTVDRRQLTSISSYDSRQWLRLAPGDYTLSVDASGATTGQAAFRLLSAASVQTLAVGAATSGSLDQARGSAIYRVTLQAGEKLHMEGRSVTNGSIGWRLIDSYGDLAASGSSLATPVTPFVVGKTGDYWLVLDGAGGNNPANTVSYDFSLNAVLDVASTLAVGDTVSGSVDMAGQSTVYSFSLAATSKLVFDSQSNRSDLLWSLQGPRGDEIIDRRFDRSDATGGTSFLALPSGSYRLTVRGSGNAVGAYAFRLLDAESASDLILGAAVTATLLPGNATHLYRFTAAAGDRLAFDSQSLTGGGANWRLIDPYGRDAAGSNNLATDTSAFLLATPGVYTLLVEGKLDNATAVDYGFQFNFVDNVPPTGLPAGDPLTLGTVVADSLATTGTSKVYRFTLAQDSTLVFDTQTNTSAFTWSLTGPRGQEVTDIYMYSSDADYRNPVYSLVAGEYALTVKAQYGTGAYAFRLLDTAAFPAINLGEQVTATRSPANSTIGYRFNAVAGESFNIRRQSGDGYWRLIDAYGKVVFSQYYYNEMAFSASTTGAYTLINEGYYYQSGSVNVSFRLDKVIEETTALVLNDSITGNLAGGHEYDRYTFTLTAPTTLVLDILQSPSARADYISWTITGSGATNYSFGYNDQVTLGPGQYTLTVRSTDYLAHDYKFRMLTRDAASVLSMDTPISGVLTPDASTLLYRFDGSKGQRLYFDGQDSSYSYNYSLWRLTDAYGNSVATGYTYSDYSQVTLPTSGEYLLKIQHDFSYDSATQRTASFKVIPEKLSQGTLTLDADTSGTISQPNERVKYSFTLGGPTSILVDTWGTGGLSNVNWTLTGPRGSEASGRSFTDSSGNVLNLPAGDYEFTVATSNLYTGGYNFRVTDLANAAALDLDTATHMSVGSGDRSRALRFSVADKTELLFDSLTTGISGDWAIYDTSGRYRTNGSLGYDSSRFTLGAGEYYLVLNGTSASVTDFDMALRVATTKTGELTLGAAVSDTLQAAQRAEYTFRVNTATTLLFDSLSNNSNLRWDLVGPSGSYLRSSVGFDYSESGSSNSLIALDAPGDYKLQVYSYSNAAADFGLRLHDLGAAPVVTMDGQQILPLNPGNTTQILAFDSLAGDYFSYRFDALSSGSAQVWQIGANGMPEYYPRNANQNFSFALSNTGRHYLVIQGGLANNEPAALSFTAELARNRTMALTLDTEARSIIGAQGVTDTWTFTLDSAKSVLFDGLAGGSVSWSLLDAVGNQVTSGGMADLRVFALTAGEYRLVVRGSSYSGSVPGAYGFRILDVAGAVSLAEGTSSVNQTALHAADVYRLSAQVGDRFYLQAVENSEQAGRLTVFNPLGQLVTSAALTESGFEFLPGDLAGDYLVVVDGDFATSTPLDYTLSLLRIEETQLSANLGDTLEGDLVAPNQYHTYRFTLPAYSRFIISDGGSDTGLHWRLLPVGSSASWWNAFPSNPASNNLQAQPAGEYELTLSGSDPAGSHYRIQLLDLETVLTLPVEGITDSLTSGRDAVAYGIDLATAQRLRIDLATADPAKLAWAIYRDYALMSSSLGVALDTQELSAGQYTLVVYGNAPTPESVAFTLNVSPVPIHALTLGETVTAAFPSTGNQVDYAFTLDASTAVLFDALASGADVRYSIRHASGYTVLSGYFSSDAYEWSRLVNLEAGSYTLQVTRSYASVAADFTFRLASPAQLDGGNVSLDTALTGSLSTGREAVVHRFTVQPGDTISIDPVVSGGDHRWRLLDPVGNTVISTRNSSYNNYYVRKAGSYTLILDGALSNTAALDYTLNVSLVSHVDPLPVGEPLPLGTLSPTCWPRPAARVTASLLRKKVWWSSPARATTAAACAGNW